MTIEKAVEAKLENWRRKLPERIWANPPVNLEEIGNAWGVKKVLRRPLETGGFHNRFGSNGGSGEAVGRRLCVSGLLLNLDEDGFAVVLNENEPLVRQRFTWAHELGHILMANHESIGISRVNPGEVDRELERCCDAIAAELLMPNEQFCSAAEKVGWKLNGVGGLARLFQVSVESAAIRMHTLLHEPVVMSVWQASKRPMAVVDQRWAQPNNPARELKPNMQWKNNPEVMKPIFEAWHSSNMATGHCRMLVKSSKNSTSRSYKWVPTDAFGIGQGKTRRVIGFHYLARQH